METEFRISNTVSDLIENPISTIRSELVDVSDCVTTLDALLVDTREKLQTDKAELQKEQEKIRQQTYVTTEQVERLIQNQLSTLESVIVGFQTCSKLSTNINNQLNKKLKRLTRFTAAMSLLFIAALVFAFMR